MERCLHTPNLLVMPLHKLVIYVMKLIPKNDWRHFAWILFSNPWKIFLTLGQYKSQVVYFIYAKFCRFIFKFYDFMYLYSRTHFHSCVCVCGFLYTNLLVYTRTHMHSHVFVNVCVLALCTLTYASLGVGGFVGAFLLYYIWMLFYGSIMLINYLIYTYHG